jgi:hypothetical protein
MLASTRSLSLALIAAAALTSAARAQEPIRQSLKDAWVATSQQLLEVDYNASPTALVLKNAGDTARDFKALAFEAPTLGTMGAAVRGLVAVSGTEVWRFENGSTELPPTRLFDTAAAPSSLRFVTGVAVTDGGTILVSGYSKLKRVFEIWEIKLTPGGAPVVQARATSTPQLTDIVYVRAADVPAGSPLAGGGLLATAAKQVLFFPKSGGFMTTMMLLDARVLGLKGATDVTSADLVRETNTLMLATTERKVLTTSVAGGAVTTFATVPGSSACVASKPQRLVVRNAQGGDEAASIVADACGQVARYDFSNAASQNNLAADVATYGSGLVALAVGEGNEVTCKGNEVCSLTSGFDAIINSSNESQLLVLQFDELCDRRVAPLTCTIGTTDGGSLVLNSLLPQAIQDALGSTVQIKIPPYMFAAGYEGRFGAVLVQADDTASAASATIELDIEVLVDNAFELGVDVGLPRPTTTLSLLNQDVAAYAPDNPGLPTVRGFEATPVTVGVRNPMVGALRGFSAVIYGLQHDMNPPGPRAVTGGLPPGAVLGGATPGCSLQYGTQTFVPDTTAAAKYFVNLVACLFADEEALLTNVLPLAAFERSADANVLKTALNQVKDKLLKALSGAGPNTGAESFQAVLTQLDQFDAQLASTPFVPSLAIYKNELGVRSRVLRFNLTERAYPSLPTRGF